MHLKGRYFDEKEAVAYYQKARPRNADVAEGAAKFAEACFEALAQSMKADGGEKKPESGEKKAAGGDLTPAEKKQLMEIATKLAQQQVDSIILGKLAASYWLGLIQYEQGEYLAALDYFRVRTLQFGTQLFGSAVFWAPGAHYNIAHTLEASGQRQKAIDAYASSILLRDDAGKLYLWNDAGNLVRARWLKELDEGKDKKAEEKKPEAGKPAGKPAGEPAGEKVREKKPDEKKPDEGKK